MWQKRPRELDYRLRFEIEGITLQMQIGSTAHCNWSVIQSHLKSHSNWSLFNGTCQKRRTEQDHRLRFEIGEMTLQIQTAVSLVVRCSRDIRNSDTRIIHIQLPATRYVGYRVAKTHRMLYLVGHYPQKSH